MALQIEVRSNSRAARSDIAKLNRSVEGISRSTEKAAKGLQRTVTLITAGVAAFAAGSILTKTTDSYKRMEARIALTNKGLVEQEFAFRQLNKIALRTRNDQESLADLYSRVGRATRSLGVDQKTVLKVTESISKAITVSGSSAESANSAIVQLGQGLAAGALRGQELNSVMEQTPAVAKAIARGMGITIGELRSFAEQGKLTASAIVDALAGQADAIDEEFKRIAPTFAQSMLVLRTGAGRFIKELDQVSNSSEKLNRFLLRAGIAMNDAARPFALSLEGISNSLTDFQARIAPIGSALGAITRAFGNVGSSIADALNIGPILGFIVSQVKEFQAVLVSVVPSISGVTTFLHRLAKGVNFVAGTIDNALRPIADFIRGVADMFYDLYIEVVGNSTWPDLIKGVTSWAEKLAIPLETVKQFARNVGDSFADLSDEAKLSLKVLLASFAPMTALFLTLSKLMSNMSLSIDSSSISDFSASITEAFESLVEKGKNVAIKVADAFVASGETISNGLALALGGAITAAIFGSAGVFAALGLMVFDFINEGIDKGLGKVGTSLNSIASRAGEYAGVFAAAAVAALPDVGALIASFVAGALSSFVKELPFVGGAISTFLDSVFVSFQNLFTSIATLYAAGWLLKLFGFKGAIKFINKRFKAIYTAAATWKAAQVATHASGEATMLSITGAGAVAQQGVIAASMARIVAIITAGYALTVTRIGLAWTAIKLASLGAMRVIIVRMGAMFAAFTGGALITGIAAFGTAIVAACATAGTALGALLLNPIVALIVGGALVVGALAVAIFGEGDSFIGKLGSIKDKMDEFFGSIFGFTEDPKANIVAAISADIDTNAEDIADSLDELDTIIDDALEGLTQKDFDMSNAFTNPSTEGMKLLVSEGWDPDYLQTLFDMNGNDINVSAMLTDDKGVPFIDSILGKDWEGTFDTIAEKAMSPLAKVRNLFTSIGKDAGDGAILNIQAGVAERLVAAYDKIQGLRDQISDATDLTFEQEQAIISQIAEQERVIARVADISKDQLKTLKAQGYTRAELVQLSDEELLAVVNLRSQVKGLVLDYTSIGKSLQGLGVIEIKLPLNEFAKLGSEAQKHLLAIAKRAEELETILKKVPGTAEDQLRYDAAVIEMEHLTRAAGKFNDKLMESKQFTADLRGNFQEVLEGIFNGVNDIGDLFESVLGDIANRAISNVSESITDVIFGGDERGLGPIQGLIDGIFGSEKEIIGGAAGELASDAATANLGLVSNPMFVNVVNGMGGLTEQSKSAVAGALPGSGALLDGASVDPLGGEGGEEEGDAKKATKGLGMFTDMLQEGVTGLGGWVTQTLANIAQFFGLSVATTAQTTTASLGAVTAGSLTAAMAVATGSATLLAAALTAAAAASVIPGFATGGAISGPGTGTSDSIMARLSNGEYVINAKQTKKHRGLIEAINKGQELPGYAEGGYIDVEASSSAVMADVASRPQGTGNQTVQNINITGDISRQTKKEIFGMLPQIASGVNQQNREQNR